MRMLMKVTMPNDQFNALVQKGNVSKVLNRILEECRPEAAYFIEEHGQRCGIMVINIEHPSEIPKFAEPWFLGLNATVEFHPAMTVDDLRQAGLDDLGRKWSF